jgi:hypothetical protein
VSPLPEYWLGRIGKSWRARNESLTSEALPKRWVELLQHLDALEKRKSHPELSDPVSSMGGSNSPDMSGSDEQSR